MSKTDRYEDLSAYLDGELPDAQRARVERLIATDPEARTILDELRRVSRLTGSLPKSAAPADTDQRVLARLEREALLADQQTHSAPRLIRLWRALAIAASLAIVVTAGWYLRPELEGRTGRLASREEQLAVRTESARPVPPSITLSKDAAPGVAGRQAGESSASSLLEDSKIVADEAESEPMALAKSAPRIQPRPSDARARALIEGRPTSTSSQPTSQPTSQLSSQPASQPTTGKSP